MAAKGGAGRAQRDIADEFFPDQLGDVRKGAGGKSDTLPQRLEGRQPLADAAAHLAKPDQLHRIVMRVAGALHRCPEPLGNSEQHIVGRHVLRDPFVGTKPVLDRQDQRIRSHHPRDGLRRRSDMCRLRGDDIEITGRRAGKAGGGRDAGDSSVATDT